MGKEPIYEYETKCRKCGTCESWFFSNASAFPWRTFAVAIANYIAEPRQHFCKTCEKQTVQDVVSYTES